MLNQEGPAGHIQPAKGDFFSLKGAFFDCNVARETQIMTQCGPRTKIVVNPCVEVYDSFNRKKIKSCTIIRIFVVFITGFVLIEFF